MDLTIRPLQGGNLKCSRHIGPAPVAEGIDHRREGEAALCQGVFRLRWDDRVDFAVDQAVRCAAAGFFIEKNKLLKWVSIEEMNENLSADLL